MPARAASDAVSSSPSSLEILMRMSLSLAAALLFSTILVAPDIAAAAGKSEPDAAVADHQSAPMKKKSRRRPARTRSSSRAITPPTRSSMTRATTKRHRGLARARLRRQRRRGEPDRLRQPQARPLRRRQGLVRTRARRRSQSRCDLVVLRHVAGRAGQCAQGQGRSGKSAPDLRHRCARPTRCSRT